MRSRAQRIWTFGAVAGLMTAALVIVGSGAPAGAAAINGTNHALLARCARQVFGIDRGAATPVAGSADPQLRLDFGVLRQTRTPADVLPAVAHLDAALADAGASTYDPSATVRLRGVGSPAAAYAVPATLAPPTLSARCARLPQLAGAGAVVTLRSLESGSGPGLCVVSIQRERIVASGVQLPGRALPKPLSRLTVSETACESSANLVGYIGALGHVFPDAAPTRVLIPDGITAITYTLADGRRLTAPVAGNLATLPAALSITAAQHPTFARLGRLLASHLPTTVTETRPNAAPAITLTRPAALIPDTLQSATFLRRLSTATATGSSSDSSVDASCSARKHRCVAVIVTTVCGAQRHCTTTRRIKRYRYVGAKPPSGTTGPDTLPTGPILARLNRVVTNPRRLSLVLSGTAHRHVAVIESVSCFARRVATGDGGPTLRLAVPSRTRIELPPGRTFRSCDIAVLAVGTRHGVVHARVVRG